MVEMMEAFLAHTGGRIIIPDAVQVRPNDSDDMVSFVDVAGRVLVTFRRQDLAVYTSDGSKLASAAEGNVTNKRDSA